MNDANLQLRQETPGDYPAVRALIVQAFDLDPQQTNGEHALTDRLRQSPSFIPELSLVAVAAGQVVGHILLSKMEIQQSQKAVPSLALAPLSVLPSWQGKGIGSALIKEAHRIARNLGHGSVIVLGDADYYPRFGYRKLAHFGITLPFPAPPENCLIVELQEDSLSGVSGRAVYDAAFFL